MACIVTFDTKSTQTATHTAYFSYPVGAYTRIEPEAREDLVPSPYFPIWMRGDDEFGGALVIA